jgi:hypothetical protein
MPELRYELIGDATKFERAGRDVVDAASKMDGALNALEENIAAVTQGQIQFNEAANRFTNESGQFVSGVDAQSAALGELNKRGIQTEEQLENQIAQLERLEQVYEGDAAASVELQRRQQALQNELEAVRTAAQAGDNALEAYEQAQRGAASAGVTMRSSVAASANNLGFEFVQAAQDARFGVQGVVNQIPLMTEQFSQLQSKSGSTAGALSALASSFYGPLGLIAAGTLLVQNWDLIAGLFDGITQEAKEARKAFESVADSLIRLQDIEGPGPLTAGEARRLQDLFQGRIQQLEDQIEARRLLQQARRTQGPAQRIPGITEDNLEEILRLARASDETTEELQEDARQYEEQLKRINEALRNQRLEFEAILKQRGTLVRQEDLQAGEIGTPTLLGGTAQGVDAPSFESLLNRQGQLLNEQLTTTEELQQELTILQSSEGERLTRLRLQNQELEDQIEFQRLLNEFQVRGPQMIEGGITTREANRRLIEERRRQARGDVQIGGMAFETPIQTLARDAQNASENIDDGINRALTQSIQLASQLGATLVQAAREGGASFAQVLGSVFQTVGGIVGIANPAVGAGIAGAGTIIGSFQHGGQVNTPLQLVGEEGPEIVALPQGSQVFSHDESRRMMDGAAGLRQQQMQPLRLEIQPTTLPSGAVSISAREGNRQRARRGHTDTRSFQ